MNNYHILYQIKSIESLIARDFFNKMIDEGDIHKIPTPTQMRIISYILERENEDVYQNTLEKIFNLRRATISGVLQTMEKNNLIMRTISAKDNRTKKIILSPETKELFNKNKDRVEKLEKIITKDISTKELEIFSKVITKMKFNLENS